MNAASSSSSSSSVNSLFNAMKDEIVRLKDMNMLSSADSICHILISSSLDSGIGSNIAVAYDIYGDVLYLKQEYKRSSAYYQRAFQQLKIVENQLPSSNTDYYSKSQKNDSSNNRIQAIKHTIEAMIRYKEALCMLKLKDFVKALTDLESIPTRLRDSTMNLELGKLYKRSNRMKEAMACLKEVLSVVPSCIEAIELLVVLGVEASEITAIIDDTIRREHTSNNNSNSNNIYSNGFLHSLVNALSYKRNCEYEKSETQYKRLLLMYPRNLMFMLHLGESYIDCDRVDQANIVLKHVRLFDPLCTDNMDLYAITLKALGLDIELARLGHDMFAINQNSPIGWFVACLYADLKGDNEKALSFLEKAIQIDPLYSLAHALKGSYLLSAGHPEAAIASSFHANMLSKDISTYHGLMQVHLAVGKTKDAIHTARECLLTLPKSSSAYMMMGDLLALNADTYKEAEAMYIKSLKLNPLNKLVIANLSRILTSSNRFSEAESVLSTGLDRVSCHKLRTMYAKVLIALSRYPEAIEQLHMAISLNPSDSQEAISELEGLEGLLRRDDDEMHDEYQYNSSSPIDNDNY